MFANGYAKYSDILWKNFPKNSQLGLGSNDVI